MVVQTHIPWTYEQYLGLTIAQREALVNEANGGDD